MSSRGQADPRGRFIWHQLMTKDVGGALVFYKAVLGWESQSIEIPGMPRYDGWASEGRPIAGTLALPGEAQAGGAAAHWLSYIATANVDATVEQAVSLGGRVCVPPTDIPGIGRFSVMNDPLGAAFAVYAPTTPAPVSDPTVGDFSWHDLATTDFAAALQFYSALFGWNGTHAMDMGAAGIYQMFGIGDTPLGGMYNLPPDQPPAPAWMPYIRVPDAAAVVSAVNASGGRVLHGPHEVPGGDLIDVCLDPQGAMFGAHQQRRPE